MQLTLIAGSADGKDFVGAIKGIMEHMRTFIVSLIAAALSQFQEPAAAAFSTPAARL